jgi:dephospho-CoA kinase
MKIIVIGIVGKTASGKSTAGARIESLAKSLSRSILVIDIDSLAKSIYRRNNSILKDLRACFGDDIFYEDGTIKYEILAKKVFSQKYELEKLNKLMFPLIISEVKGLINKNKGKDFLIINAAILFNCELYRLCDYIILIKADINKRKKFLKYKKTNLSDLDIELRIRGQYIKIIKKFVDFTVVNDSSKLDLQKKVDVIFKVINKGEEIKKPAAVL